MKLKRYHSFPPVNTSLNTFFDGLFNSNIADFVGSDFAKNSPSVNIIESDKEFNIEVAAPGMEKKDFELSLEKDQLIISANKADKKEENEEKFTRREFNYTSFKRNFTLPENINANDIVASYENGVLNIVLPKKMEAEIETAKTIKIS